MCIKDRAALGLFILKVMEYVYPSLTNRLFGIKVEL